VLQVRSLVPDLGVARSWLESLATDLAFNAHGRVLIRDPRRPAPSEAVLESLFSLDVPAAAVGRLVTDTYKEVAGRRIIRTVPREGLVDAHGPWLFERRTLERAIGIVQRSGAACTGAVDLCRIAGLPVRLLLIDEP
jgi:2-C-methyl-D-erythritol 4-phosphate cytidylyltransferase